RERWLRRGPATVARDARAAAGSAHGRRAGVPPSAHGADGGGAHVDPPRMTALRDLLDSGIQGLLVRSAALLAGACALLLLIEGRGRLRQVAGVGIVLMLVAVLIGGPPAPVVAALVIGVLALDARDILHGECTVKLLWVLGAALVLSTLGSDLLVAATGAER